MCWSVLGQDITPLTEAWVCCACEFFLPGWGDTAYGRLFHQCLNVCVNACLCTQTHTLTHCWTNSLDNWRWIYVVDSLSKSQDASFTTFQLKCLTIQKNIEKTFSSYFSSSKSDLKLATRTWLDWTQLVLDECVSQTQTQPEPIYFFPHFVMFARQAIANHWLICVFPINTGHHVYATAVCSCNTWQPMDQHHFNFRFI